MVPELSIMSKFPLHFTMAKFSPPKNEKSPIFIPLGGKFHIVRTRPSHPRGLSTEARQTRTEDLSCLDAPTSLSPVDSIQDASEILSLRTGMLRSRRELQKLTSTGCQQDRFVKCSISVIRILSYVYLDNESHHHIMHLQQFPIKPICTRIPHDRYHKARFDIDPRKHSKHPGA